MPRIPEPGGASVFSGGGGAIATPFQFYLTNAENIRITSVNALAGARIVVQGRMLKRGGGPEWFRFDHTPNEDRSVKSTDHPVGDGFVLNLVAFAEGAAPRIGQTFVQVKVIGGLGGATITLGTLLQGYVTSSQELAWPGSPIQTAKDGGGAIRRIDGTAPAAGAEMFETVPTGAQWELITFIGTLATSAAAGNRQPELFIGDGLKTYARSAAPASIAASASVSFSWQQGMPFDSTYFPNAQFNGIPRDLTLLPGHSIETRTSGLLAGDQWTAPEFLVREWLEVR